MAGWQRSCLGGYITEELLQVMTGDKAAPAYFHVGQVAVSHLVVKQVAGQTGQAGGFVDGIGQPFGEVWFLRSALWISRAAGTGSGRTAR